MSRLWKHHPSPAMVVALLALFVAMGGTGYAVSKLPKRSVGPAQLRKNAVRAQHIKAGSITAAKLAKSTLASLRSPVAAPPVASGAAMTATSPSTSTASGDRVAYADQAGLADWALLADRATAADGAASADTAAVADRAKLADNASKLEGKAASDFLSTDVLTWVPMFNLSGGQTKDVVKVGPFTLTARCIVDRNGEDVADIIISTTQAKSAFDGDDLLGSLDPGDNIETRQFVNASGPTGSPRFEASSDGMAMGGDGVLYIKGSQMVVGVNVMGQTGKCRFGGYLLL